MNELVQRLDIVPDSRRSEYLPAKVLTCLPIQDVIVFVVDDDASDTARFSERYGFDLEDCANTIVLRYRRAGVEQHAAVVTLGSRRLDVNGAVKERLGAQRLSFAKREVATELTGMEFGGITAFGVPDDWTILVDSAVMDRQQVVMGAGVRLAKLLLPPTLLVQLPNVDVAPLTLETP
jgi:prolyl-tRNA editing enzyme YbaK/EbsC (Cys-tRNA(Pro) deacylase)